MKPQPIKPVMSAQEAADYLGLHYLTVLKLAKRGELPAKRIGKRYFFQYDTLFRFMDVQPNDITDEK